MKLAESWVEVQCTSGEATHEFNQLGRGAWPETEVACVCGRCWHARVRTAPGAVAAGPTEIDLVPADAKRQPPPPE